MRTDELNAAEQQRITLVGVREHEEGYPVELVRAPGTGRVSVRATNEGGNGEVYVDLWDLLEVLRSGPPSARTDKGFFWPVTTETAKGEVTDGRSQT